MNNELHIVAAGLNHRTAPIEVREQVAFGNGRLEAALIQITDQPALGEAVILSTCNRAELYAAASSAPEALDALARFLSEFHGVEQAAVSPHLYRYEDEEAVRHLFTVAVGLDSMVLGEGQILAQVKQALLSASEAGSARTCLQELFQRALSLGKRARTETAIARGAVSISSAAVDLAKTTFGDLKGREVLVVGAGEMSRQTLTHLVDSGVKSVIVANRTFENADELAGEFGGSAIRFDEFPQHLDRADIIVSSSSAPHAIITVEKLRPHLATRRGRPLFIVDIAVPRDVEPAVADLEDVYLFDIDDLQTVCDRYRAERAKEAEAVAVMVDEETRRFEHWLGSRAVTPLLVELRTRTEALRDTELERWMRRLPNLEPEERELVGQMMRSFANKLLHGPTTHLRAMAGREQGAEWVPFVRSLFELHEHIDAQSDEEDVR
ncbi:MAG: glutamyl-tRNA reductase [Armatimonadetes bacterium]|nr:glutamyl-tRNA reductase [Armatimonadota bacterium]